MRSLPLAVLALSAAVHAGLGEDALPPLVPVPWTSVRVQDAYWSPRLATLARTTLPHCLRQCEDSGRLGNFAVAGGLLAGDHVGNRYDDSDVYKLLEGLAYVLGSQPDDALRRRLDTLVDLVTAAQRSDGYLNTWITTTAPLQRWQDVAQGHELYCAGHLLEAALAIAEAIGDTRLLAVADRFTRHIDQEFGSDARLDPPGHPELELALLRLWRRTGESGHLELARFFLEQRGRGEDRALYGSYAQDHLPIREQREAAGHAVRATYLYAAMAELAAATGDAVLRDALVALWNDVVERRLYVTGGIGSSGANEGFTAPYDLPNESAYCETCASIGLAIWSHRMVLLTGQARYADVLERAAYNNVLAGLSLSGDRFFYENPLASGGQHHRSAWFSTACCPTNLVRFLPSLAGRVWASGVDGLYLLLYVAGDVDLTFGGSSLHVTLQGRYPWDGQIALRLRTTQPGRAPLHLRRPAWCSTRPTLYVDGVQTPTREDARGWIRIDREWDGLHEIRIDLAPIPRRTRALPEVTANQGRVALEYGPLVFAVEGADHGGHVRQLFLPPEAALRVEWDSALLGGTLTLRAAGQALREVQGEPRAEPAEIVAIPYALWDNRAPGEMAVWLPESADRALPPGREHERVQNGVTIRASHCYAGDTTAAANDGLLPSFSADDGLPRHTFWDHRGTTEWLEYIYPQSRSVSRTRVYWFDDTGRGSCRVPAAWRLLWWDGASWRPVELRDGQAFAVARDAFQEALFEPVTTAALRLEVQLQDGWSGGVLEWEIDA